MNATTPYAINHPIVMPKKGHVTVLLIRQFHHEKQHHQGYGMTHNAIHQAGYHIINGRSLISHIIAKCVLCRKLRRRTQDQQMAALPPERVTPSPPFTYTGMDVFGPFYIREGRKELKRWGLIFTCLSSRAIHLETLNAMSTDSFLNALRRFISRRGKARELRSDQGTNFVGAKNELVAALKELDTTPVKEYLSSQDCDENLRHQTCILANVGEEFSTSLTNSGCAGRKNTVPNSKNARNGLHLKEISKKETSY